MSKTKLRNAQYSINECIKTLTHYSYASKADMRHMLNRCIKDLHTLGYQVTHVNGLKPKHIYALVEHWKNEQKNPATIKNYMSKLRKLAVILNKPNLVKPNNDAYQINRRSYIPTSNKAIHNIDFSKCDDLLIRLSLEAQSLFGLRREESMKIIVSEAAQGNNLVIQPSWTKGGIGRTMEITNQEQREWIAKTIQQVNNSQSLIPQNKTYKQHLRQYQEQTKKMGLKRCHGLRHAYAQRRYNEITQQLSRTNTPLPCPIDQNNCSKKLSTFEKSIDRQAREIISRELGHSRLAITKIYIG